MLKNIRKYFEYGFFIILNIGLLSPIYLLLFFFVVVPVSFLITTKVFKVPQYLVINFDDPTIFFVSMGLLLLILLFKPLIFIILYLLKNLFPNINIILKTLRKNSKFFIFIIVLAFVLDFVSCLFFQYIIILYFGYYINLLPISLLFGLLFNYFLFFLFFPPFIKNNIKSNIIKHIIKFIFILIRTIIILIFSALLIFSLILLII